MPTQFAKLFAGNGNQIDDSTLGYTLTCLGTTNATLVVKGPTAIASIVVLNSAATVRYLRFYDIAVVPTAGIGTPCRKYMIPAATTGAGFVLAPTIPMKFMNGIAFTITTGAADTDATAPVLNDVVLTIEYLVRGLH